ncbi:MAG: DNA topoisomerase III, partial [Lachnospiraceae bacterium]|nr:DNA topoisomerase III [Lachnospiraceae bacterium]
CGMNVSRYFKTPFTDTQIKELLAGKQILLKGLIGKNNRMYDMFLKPTGIEEYSYEKNGKTITGYQFVYEKSYPKKSAKKKKQ